MILKSLTLQNFRSYGEAPTRIEFERGISLFEGDIGSGKSSILYAIEFALFGLGDVEARSILRSSASTARVELEFESGGRDYVVARTAERRGTGTRSMIVTKGWLSSHWGDDGEVQNLEELAPTELRARILKILNFREKPGRSTSRIFRFAVFTPQELMREVLAQRPEERIETLRRAFGVEDYSFAMENAEVAARELRASSLIHAGLARSLPEKEEARTKLALEVTEERAALARREEEIQTLDREFTRSKKNLEALEAARDEARSLETLIPELERSLEQLLAQRQREGEKLELARRDLAQTRRAKGVVETLSLEYARLLSAREEAARLDHLRDEELALERQISEIKNSISARESSLRAELLSRQDDLRRCEATMRSLESTLSERPALEQRISELKLNLGGAEGLEAELDIVRSEVASREALCSSILREIQSATSDVKKMDGLKGESACPLCGQRLDPQHVAAISVEFSTKMNALNAELQSSTLKLEELKERLEALGREKRALESARGEYEACARRLAALEQAALMRARQERESLEIRARVDAVRSLLARAINEPDSSSSNTELLHSLERKRSVELAPRIAVLAELRSFIEHCAQTDLEKRYLAAQASASREPEAADLLRKEEESIAHIESSLSTKSAELETSRAQLESLEPKIYEYSATRRALEEMEMRRSNLRSACDALSAALAIKEAQLRGLEDEISHLKLEAERASLLRAVASWIDSPFIPTVRDIETYVLDSINEEFEKVFQRWFAILVEEGDITVALDERFTPVVEQSGYELDVHSLSGGERTAVALAYRLALNFMVRRAATGRQGEEEREDDAEGVRGAKARQEQKEIFNDDNNAPTNLLILDEPTEGFSKEQIYRLRNVLEELEADQVIVVSHERDLETMADQVYRVEKVGGESRVRLITAA